MNAIDMGGMPEAELLILWLGFGFLSWILFVVFIGRVLGYKEFRKPYVKRTGVVTLSVMVALGFLSLLILITVAIPFFESFIDPKSEGI